ncbi:MAG: manganese efflux pump [Chloroflexi bacterium]|nr:manganese efflux pump [Chloroflexota bacterium]MBV9897432.1 manganese efflux pump [Chloroflexota bacterium]
MLALLLLSPVLGLDNFVAAAAIGVASSGWRTCARVCAVFGAYAVVTPLLGLVVGDSVARAVGDVARPLGGGVLLALGGYRLVTAWSASAQQAPPATGISVRALMAVGLGVSLDTIAAGFGLGLYGVSLPLAVATVALGTIIMSFLGFQLAAAVRPRLAGTRPDLVAAVALSLVGTALAIKLL